MRGHRVGRSGRVLGAAGVVGVLLVTAACGQPVSPRDEPPPPTAGSAAASQPASAEPPVPSVVTVPPLPTSTPEPEPTPEPETEPQPEPPPAPEPAPAPEPVDALTGNAPVVGPVVAVKIDNTAAGLPQYGLAQADIVVLEEVEGGMTRLMAVFHTVLPNEVGPVRSVRTTDAELLPIFGVPILAFSGGAGGPLSALRFVGALDGSGAGRWWRSPAARAPYDLHVDVASVGASTSGWTDPLSVGWTFSAAAPAATDPRDGSRLTARFPAATQTFQWDGGRYQVGRAGTSLADASGTPVTADNVLVLRVAAEPDGTVDSVGSPSMVSHTVGTGSFTLLRDGVAVAGTWTRPALEAGLQLTDAAGAPVPLKPGRTWLVLATPGTAIS
ncbi:DUF3048 domain-containing protein [Nakamurella leprariae]|uniref:DUF3048 domain-containing protein n=1 Tax=Nakamurella leprariae TaxID=2803911 RepID=A0A939BYW5_9ACTN|nr:DUF3048 domain-containing protein [Nakamurella leprariae]MBM9467051.1 DUF3048 domain-containing protein [Nakamurella leprariae]